MSGNRYFFHQSQSYCRHAPGFNFPGEQSNGPRADRSRGYKKSQVNIRLANAPRNFFD